MGSTVFHKLLRNQSHPTAARIIPLINKSVLKSSSAAAGVTSSHFPVSPTTSLQIPLSGQPESGGPTPSRPSCSQYFPSFSIGFLLNPNPPTTVAIPDVDGGVSSCSPAIWADSVKKKRKRKMNKHKLRKMRKAERRKKRA